MKIWTDCELMHTNISFSGLLKSYWLKHDASDHANIFKVDTFERGAEGINLTYNVICYICRSFPPWLWNALVRRCIRTFFMSHILVLHKYHFLFEKQKMYKAKNVAIITILSIWIFFFHQKKKSKHIKQDVITKKIVFMSPTSQYNKNIVQVFFIKHFHWRNVPFYFCQKIKTFHKRSELI